MKSLKVLSLVAIFISSIFLFSCNKEDEGNDQAKVKVEKVAGSSFSGKTYVGIMAVTGKSVFSSNNYTVSIKKIADDKIKIEPSTSDADSFEATVNLNSGDDLITFTVVNETSTTGIVFTKLDNGNFRLSYGLVKDGNTNAFVGEEK